MNPSISMRRSMPSLFQPSGCHSHPEEVSMVLAPELVRRISSWRMSIEPDSLTNPQAQSPTSSSPSSIRAKNRVPKPYLRPKASLRSRLSSASIPDTEPAKSGASPQVSAGHSMVQLHQPHTSPAPSTSRGAYDLPDPARNPLVSRDPALLVDDYCRIMLIYEQVNEKKRQLEMLILRQPCRDATRHLLDIGASAQRIMRSLQYIVVYAKGCGHNLDFDEMYARYCNQLLPPPLPPLPATRNVPQDGFIKMPQARAFSEGWKINPL